MTINYTTLLGLALPVTGTESGTWGDDVNLGITDYLDISISGTNNITNDSDITLSITNGSSSGSNIVASPNSTTAQYMQLLCTGARTANRNINAPNSSKMYIVNNSTTGGYSIIIRGVTGPTTGVTVVNGEKALVYWSSVLGDFVKITSTVITNLTGTLSTANGGTGLTSFTANGVVYASSTSALATGSANLTFDGTTLTANTLSVSTSTTTPIVQSSGSLLLKTNGTTTAVTIDTSQNVLIGSTSSASLAKLNVYGAQTYDSASATFSSWFSGGTLIGYIGQGNYAVSGASATGISFASQSSMSFATGGNTERMRIDTSGNLLVGRTSSSGTSAGIVAGSNGTLKVFGDGQTTANTVYNAFTNGNSSNTDLIEFNVGQYQRTCIYVRNSGCGAGNQANHITFQYGTTPTNAGYITSVGATTSYSSASDYRLKTNVTPMANSLAKIAQLKPCTFNWIENNAEGQGFIAHELQEVFPDAVIGKKDELDDNGKIKPQAIDTSFLVATLVSAIQELSAQVTALEAKVGA